MSLSLNNPLIIGDINKKTKEDISQIKQDIGDLSQLDTADKSSLVNALNEAIDSTLNGASRDLDNLSDAGNDKLRSLNSYANEGELLTDPDGLAFVENYAHSTFDLSKFTVVGSPNITDDGIASGFSQTSYIQTPDINLSGSWDLYISAMQTNTNDTTNRLFRSTDGNFEMTWLSDGVDLSIGQSGTIYKTNKITLIATQNTYYTFKISYDNINGVYSLKYKVNNSDWVTLATSESGKTNINTTRLNLGTNTGVNNRFLIGSIDLKQFSITVDGVEVFSGNKTGIDTIKPDDYTVVGTPTISDDGIASGFSASNHLYKFISFTLTNTKKHKFSFRIYTDPTSQGLIIGTNLNFNSVIYYENSNKKIIYSLKGGSYYLYSAALSDYKWYDVVCEYDGISTMYCTTTDVATGVSNQTQKVDVGEFSNSITILEFGYRSGVANYFSGKIDLNAVKVEVDGDSIYQPCLKIPYTESKTGSKVVNAIYRDRVNDMAEQFGYANYYTLSDTDFTLPQVELYGLIGQRTLRDSYRNGINYWELYSNRDLEQGGSCTSGVEVTFARPFADTNYVLSVPYSAKSTTAFTPTQTGDFIAKGKGLL